MIRVDGLRKSFSTRSGVVQAVDGVSFDAADDPDGLLVDYRQSITGHWLYAAYAMFEDAALEQGGVLAPVRDVDDDRVGPPEQHRPESLRRLVVEDPLPPAASHVLGDDDEGDRRLAVRRPGRIEDIEVGEERSGQRPGGVVSQGSSRAR